MAESKKKILLFSPAIYPCSVGGVEVFNYYLACELAKTRSIMVATSCKITFGRSIEKINLINRLFIIKRFGLSRLSLIISGFFQLAMRRSTIGLIHVPYTSSSGYLGVLFYLVKKVLRLPYILHIHAGGMGQWKIKLFHRLFFKHADRIIAVSEIIQKEYERRTNRHIQVILPLIPFSKSINNKMDLKRSFGLKTEDIIILVVGSIKPIKGSEIILKSFMSLGIEFVKKEKLKLIFVGDGQQRKDMESRILHNNEFNDHVRFMGSLPHEKLPDVYAIANIYVIASWFEGTPISLLEAMYNGLPIIGSNVKGINNIISDKENGLLFEKSNDLELAENIQLLMRDKKTATEIGRNARSDYEKKYDYPQTFRAFEDIYSCYLLN